MMTTVKELLPTGWGPITQERPAPNSLRGSQIGMKLHPDLRLSGQKGPASKIVITLNPLLEVRWGRGVGGFSSPDNIYIIFMGK
jgi:hypothetical protein